jgi:hypothetical protein
LVHIITLPADSAFVRKQLNAPLGWDSTTEMVASAVDSINFLARLFQNANYQPDKSNLARTPRPYEDAVDAPEPQTISLSEFVGLMNGG